MNANQEYTVLGSGGSEGETHEFITQADYDNLTPAQKAEKVYMITGEGGTPSPITGGDFIPFSGNCIETNIFSTIEGYFITYGSSLNDLRNSYGTSIANKTSYNILSIIGNDEKMYSFGTTSGTYYRIQEFNKNGLPNVISVSGSFSNIKADSEYWYSKNGNTYSKIDTDGNVTTITQQEYDSIPNGQYYKGLWYSQDNNDYVAVDSTNTEVKRYSGVGTVSGIYNNKLYKIITTENGNTNGYIMCCAIATI